MSAEYNGLQVIYPTRNRAELATRAIRSLLDQPGGDVAILVSDNSTEPAERERLSAFIEQLQDPRVGYITPPEPLDVNTHWDWAIGQVLARSRKNHFTLLTDRILYKHNVLHHLLDIVRGAPERVLSFPIEMIRDARTPIEYQPYPATGQLVEVPSARLFALTARALFAPALPFLFNCIVPRPVFALVKEHYGKYCASLSPDAAFGYRLLTQLDWIRFFDAPPNFFHRHTVSNSRGWIRGYPTKATFEYATSLNKNALHPSLPAPDWVTPYNLVMHEYSVVRAATASRLPPIDRVRYFDLLQQELDEMENLERKQEMQKQLNEERHTRGAPLTRLQKMRRQLRPLTRWVLARRTGRPFQFQTQEEAVQFALNRTAPIASNSWFLDLVTGRAM